VVDNLKGIPKNSTMELLTVRNTLLKKKKCCRDFQLGKQKIRRKKTKGQNIMFHHLFNLLFDVSTRTKSSPQKNTYLGISYELSREL